MNIVTKNIFLLIFVNLSFNIYHYLKKNNAKLISSQVALCHNIIVSIVNYISILYYIIFNNNYHSNNDLINELSVSISVAYFIADTFWCVIDK